MPASRPALAAALLLCLASASVAADPPLPSRSHVEDIEVVIAKTTATSVTYKYTAVVPTGRTTGSGRNRRPQVKAEEKEETIDVIDKVVVKDAKAKEGKGDFTSLAAGQQVKLHVSKETIRPVGEKPQSKLVVTQIDVIHTKGDTAPPAAKPDPKK